MNVVILSWLFLSVAVQLSEILHRKLRDRLINRIFLFYKNWFEFCVKVLRKFFEAVHFLIVFAQIAQKKMGCFVKLRPSSCFYWFIWLLQRVDIVQAQVFFSLLRSGQRGSFYLSAILLFHWINQKVHWSFAKVSDNLLHQPLLFQVVATLGNLVIIISILTG